MADRDSATPDEAAGARRPTTPDRAAAAHGADGNVWIAQALNRANDRLDGIEKRLRRVENRIAWALGLAIGVGFVVGVLFQAADLSFRIAIVPAP